MLLLITKTTNNNNNKFTCALKVMKLHTIAVIAVAPTGKASFVYSYVQTRLKGQYNGT